MKLRKAVVVYKKSSYELYGQIKKDKKFLKLISSKHPIVHRFVPGHKAHQKSFEKIRQILKRHGIEATFIYRSKKFSEKNTDLVITLGGDGTFLEASHSILHTPILGVNSNPEDSVGMFCGTNIDTLEEYLEEIRLGRAKSLTMTRLKVRQGSKVFPHPILNDVLITNATPAATSRLIVDVGKKREEFKCSGIWIAPAAGTTAGIRSAGGKVLPIQFRGFQFVIREPYVLPGTKYSLISKVLSSKDEIVVHSKMRTGGIYLDGSHKTHRFSLGEQVSVTTHPNPLIVFGFNEKRRRLFE